MSLFAADWFSDLGKLLDSPWTLALYAVVLIAGFAVGAAISGFVIRRLAMLLWRDLTRAALFRIRLGGGSAGAVLAYLLIGWGGGFGFGPGEGGVPSTGDQSRAGADAASSESSAQPSQASPQGLLPQTAEGRVLKVRLLGGRSSPKAVPPDAFFVISGNPLAEPVDIDAVIRRGKELQPQGLKEVELIVTLDPPSTVLENPIVGRLRERVLKDLQVPFVQPDPDKLFEEPFASRKVRYDPPR